MSNKKVESFCQNWCITLYHEDSTNTTIPLIEELPEFLDYFEYGVEKCPDTGRMHLQCNAKLKARSRVATVVNKFKKLGYKCGGKGVDPMKGSWEQATTYVKKGADYIGTWETDKIKHPSYGKGLVYHTFGNRPVDRSGERNDLKRIMKGAEKGMTEEEMVKSDFISNYQQLKVAQSFIGKYSPKRGLTKAPIVEVFYGVAGSGKSHDAITENPDAFVTNLNGDKWLENYGGQTCIIFEEFRGSYMPLTQLIRVTDKYELTAKVNYTTVRLMATKFVFTSAHHPKEWYPNCDGEKYDQLDGRISRIKYYGKPHPLSQRHKLRSKDHVCDEDESLNIPSKVEKWADFK